MKEDFKQNDTNTDTVTNKIDTWITLEIKILDLELNSAVNKHKFGKKRYPLTQHNHDNLLIVNQKKLCF